MHLGQILTVWGVLFCAVPPCFLHAQTAHPYATQEKPHLVLYYSPRCVYSQKVLSYLQSVDKSIPRKDVTANPEAKQELKRYGGKLQVPCLFIDGHPLYESDQIIQWLSQHQEDLEFAPPSPELSLYRKILSE